MKNVLMHIIYLFSCIIEGNCILHALEGSETAFPCVDLCIISYFSLELVEKVGKLF